MLGIRRVTTGSKATLTRTWYPQDSETATDPDGTPGACTYGITHVNGTVITAAGTAATRTGVGVFTAALPPQANPAALVVTWAASFGGTATTAVDYVEVIGGHMVDLAEIRALDGLDDTTAYPTALLIERRDDAELVCEQATGTYWTPHYVRETFDGDVVYRRSLQSSVPMSDSNYVPNRRLILGARLPRSISSVMLDGVAGTPSDYLLYKSGEVEVKLTSGAFPRGIDNVVVEYFAGADAPPQDLRFALKTYIRELVLGGSSRIPDRATAMTTEFGTFRIGQARAWDNPTGIPAVDAVFNRYGERLPAFA